MAAARECVPGWHGNGGTAASSQLKPAGQGSQENIWRERWREGRGREGWEVMRGRGGGGGKGRVSAHYSGTTIKGHP